MLNEKVILLLTILTKNGGHYFYFQITSQEKISS